MFDFQVDGSTARVVLPARFILDSLSRGSKGELLLGFTCREGPAGHGAPNTSAPCPAHHHTATSPSSLSGSSSHPSHPSPPGGKLVSDPSPRPLSASSSHPSHPSPPGGKLDSPPSQPLPSPLLKDFDSSPQSVKSSESGSIGLSEEDSKHVWFRTPRSQWISRQGRRERSFTPCPRWARTPTPEDTESDNLSDAGSSPPTPSPLQEDSHPTPQDETSYKTGPPPSEASVNEFLPSVSPLTSSSDTSLPSSRPSAPHKDSHSSPQSVKSSESGSIGLSEEDSKHVWFNTPRSQWISRQGRRERSFTPCPRWARTPTPEDTESDNLSDAGSSPPTPSPLQEDLHPTPQDETSSKTGPPPSEASVNEFLPSVSPLTSSSDTSSPSSRPSAPNKDSHSSPQSETSLSTSSPPPPPPTLHPSIYFPPQLTTSLGTISPSPSLHEPSHSPPLSVKGSGSKLPPRRGRLKPWLIILTMAEVAGWLLLSTMW